VPIATAVSERERAPGGASNKTARPATPAAAQASRLRDRVLSNSTGRSFTADEDYNNGEKRDILRGGGANTSKRTCLNS
jgi:hypothetical protein